MQLIKEAKEILKHYYQYHEPIINFSLESDEFSKYTGIENGSKSSPSTTVRSNTVLAFCYDCTYNVMYIHNIRMFNNLI